ncbi:hypothetical protein BCV70DRAFT_201400 [Testicularia cyperi]|uniref:Uncharacterized protein n=1 Tax=Testicularia cyperi TaxID=1882483 RepID=A0A317XLK5_9BASI|nr:hypothetical protein BCV70DRAFT_201400 [Testicularia cyperi]
MACSCVKESSCPPESETDTGIFARHAPALCSYSSRSRHSAGVGSRDEDLWASASSVPAPCRPSGSIVAVPLVPSKSL